MSRSPKAARPPSPCRRAASAHRPDPKRDKITSVTTAPYGFLRVAAACPPVRVADPERNVDAILAAIAEATRRRAQVLVLPELSLTGYTCGDLFFSLDTLVAGAERALGRLLKETAGNPLLVLVGLPVLQGSRLFNAAALLQSGALRGVVPKTFLPGYKEYYEERWFSSSREAVSSVLPLAGRDVPFGTDLLFAVEGEPGIVVGVEICEDLWAPIPPSCQQAIAGATLILNPSAGNDLVAKADYRRQLVAQQSARTLSAYAYANAGVHESTTDLVFGGHLLIAEHGIVLAESERFRRQGELVCVDVDTDRLRVERARQTSFAEAVHGAARPFRTIALQPIPADPGRGLLRTIEPQPFVPADPAHRRRALPGGVLDPDRWAGAPRRARGLEAAGARPVGRARLDAGAAGLRAHARPARASARRRAGSHHARLRHHAAHARQRAPARPRLGRRAARDRHPPRLRAAHPRHRSRPRGPQHHLPEPAGSRAHAAADGPRQHAGRHRGRHGRSVGDRPRLRHLRGRPHLHVRRERQRAEDPRAPAGGVGGGAPGERRRARGAAGGARHARLARAAAARRGRQPGAAHRGPDRPLRAARLLPLQPDAARRGPAQDRAPRLPRLRRPLRRGDAAPLAAACSSSASSPSSSSAR